MKSSVFGLLKSKSNGHQNESKINHVHPGITGIASIVFRDEEKYYASITEDPHVFCKRVMPSELN
jgi:lipopolysaccharide/colanic/teichoic acid biosynthesis glycosyltransferase